MAMLVQPHRSRATKIAKDDSSSDEANETAKDEGATVAEHKRKKKRALIPKRNTMR